MKKLLPLLCLLFPLYGGDFAAGGKIQPEAGSFSIYAGIGEVSSLEGRVQETLNGSLVSGGIDTNLVDLNIGDGSEVMSVGGQLSGKWFTLLVDYRQSDLSASGTAQTDIRLNVDNVVFAGTQLNYLLIPAGSEYDLSADTSWLGLGLRFTPFTLNPEGRVRITPWLHLGAQYIVSDFNIDAGSTVDLDVAGFNGRVYAVNGSASGEAQLVVPEAGLGGEIRLLFHESDETGPQISLYGTYKILEYDGSLDTIGVEDDAFEDLSLSYNCLELGANLFFPVSESMDILLGIYFEQVESNTVLNSKASAGGYQREIDLNYDMLGVRAGLRF